MTSGFSDDLAETLHALGYADSDGLLTQDPIASNSFNSPDSREYLWRDLKFKVGLDAAFFHDGVPLVGFTDARPGGSLPDLRRRLWNYGRVPILLAATDGGFTAYNALENPNIPDVGQLASEPDQRSGIAGSLASAFSRKNVEAGEFSALFP
jgi:hypothetical protein